MLGFSPIATAPLASDVASNLVYVVGQTFSSIQSSLGVVADANITLESQPLNFTQNNFSITADSVYVLLKQVDMVMSVNSVDLGVYINLDLTGQTIVSAVHSVGTEATANVIVTGQTPLQLSQNSTYETIAFRAPSQTIHTALHSMRMWNKINTSQSANWTPIDTTQSPGWTEIET